MSPLCLVILHLLQGVRIYNYSQKLDTDDTVIMDVSGLSKKFVHVKQELKTPLSDQFLNGLQEDEFGNIQYRSESGHLITLHYSAYPVQLRCK